MTTGLAALGLSLILLLCAVCGVVDLPPRTPEQPTSLN